MTKRLLSSFLLGCAALLLFASTAEAQVVRPSNTLFFTAHGGVTAYGGELDGTGFAFGEPDSELGWLFSDLGFAGGAELGYQFDEHLGLAFGFLYGQYTNLDRTDAVNPITQVRGQLNDSNTAHQIQALFRYMPWPSGKITPYVQFGGAMVLGQGEDTSGSRVTGYGPNFGAGLDLLLGRQLSLFLEASTTFVFPDDAVDNSNPG
ncbi:MAG: outer membrane beta-barrel protein, partial [Rubricoccaceae bacterium]|nr:outer membrane beta-barrel protein [Rubricoccaceae bacterium]